MPFAKCWEFKESKKQCPLSWRFEYYIEEFEMERSLWTKPLEKVQFEITGSRKLVNSRWKLMLYCFNVEDVNGGRMSNKLKCCRRENSLK